MVLRQLTSVLYFMLYHRNPEHKVSSVFAKDLENTFLSDPLKEVCYNGLYCAPTMNRHQ